MSQIEMLRLLITQRLTAAAEEIYGVFGRIIAEYEEQISRYKIEIQRQRHLQELREKPSVCVLARQQDWSYDLYDHSLLNEALIHEFRTFNVLSIKQSAESFNLKQSCCSVREVRAPRPASSATLLFDQSDSTKSSCRN
ncbi:B-cell lymphoma 6 protein homolog [Scomber scombrus]|uniref:B-cell lymphoma 6 protein homolog n=1 Tax=Scomber scombrus TaxID=13677 RepID=A0AAV1QCS8_SCOSC